MKKENILWNTRLMSLEIAVERTESAKLLNARILEISKKQYIFENAKLTVCGEDAEDETADFDVSHKDLPSDAQITMADIVNKRGAKKISLNKRKGTFVMFKGFDGKISRQFYLNKKGK